MPRVKRDSAAKCWQITVQLDQEATPGALFWHNWLMRRCRDLGDEANNIQGYVFQLEVGEEDGRKHWQMHMKLKKRKRLAWFYESEIFTYNGITGFHAEIAIDEHFSWRYAQKEETRLAGPFAFGPRRLYYGDDYRYWLPHDADDDSSMACFDVPSVWLSSDNDE